MAATLHPEAITSFCGRPVERPVMLQGWHDLTSLHWPYDPDVVQRLLPSGLRVDTCDGSAWVGLIPFQMRRIRVPGLPPLGSWSTFPETNIRSYVVDEDGRRAVWFHSLDVSRLAPAVVARVTYGLPYCWASMSITHPGPRIVEYSSERRWPRRGPASRVGDRRVGSGSRSGTRLTRRSSATWNGSSPLGGPWRRGSPAGTSGPMSITSHGHSIGPGSSISTSR